MADRLEGYVDGCRDALLSGNVSHFAELTLETETVTDAVTVMGWRGPEEGGLTVSLLRRGTSSGVCDVAYRPLAPSADLVESLATLTEALAVADLAKEPNRVELVQAGQVILTCAKGQGMALYLDPTAKGVGFAAQVATVPPHRMKCEG
ncbi:MAG: hypothetical protein AAGP08_14445 [Pseudomonadota bacterium]